MKLLDLRERYNLTQMEVAELLHMPVRTYIRYEKDETYGNNLKREMMKKTVMEECEITETKGLLTIEQIRTKLVSLFENEYKDQIEFCFLFGSYAKGYARENSDVDLCISTNLEGFKFIGLTSKIRSILSKEVDVIRLSNLKDNLELLSEIMKDGIKIYG